MSNFTRNRAKGKMVCNHCSASLTILSSKEYFTTLSRHLKNCHPEILVETNAPSAKLPNCRIILCQKTPNQNSPRYQNCTKLPLLCVDQPMFYHFQLLKTKFLTGHFRVALFLGNKLLNVLPNFLKTGGQKLYLRFVENLPQ